MQHFVLDSLAFADERQTEEVHKSSGWIYMVWLVPRPWMIHVELDLSDRWVDRQWFGTHPETQLHFYIPHAMNLLYWTTFPRQSSLNILGSCFTFE